MWHFSAHFALFWFRNSIILVDFGPHFGPVLSILDQIKHQPGRKTNSLASKLFIFWRKNFFIFRVKKIPKIVTQKNSIKQTLFWHFLNHFFKSHTAGKKCLFSGGKNSFVLARKVNGLAPKTKFAEPKCWPGWHVVTSMWPKKLKKITNFFGRKFVTKKKRLSSTTLF